MNSIAFSCLAGLFFGQLPVPGEDPPGENPHISLQRLERIDEAVNESIANGDCPGAVVCVLSKGQTVYLKSFGHKRLQPEKVELKTDAIFDLASLTKPVATATAVMILIEQGKLRPSDRVSTHWPEFAANGKELVTVEQCLIHTTGLTADNTIADYADGKKTAIEKIAGLKLEAPPGTRFRYSDVGFIVLGELVERISGQPLDRFVAQEVFSPLGMKDTGYNPDKSQWGRIAPTGNRQGKPIVGVVHDPRAHAMDGVAGHAGLFSTAEDLAKYCNMLLGGGSYQGKRILSPLTVRMMTEPIELPVRSEQPLARSRGWDVNTGFTSQRGELFPAGTGYGHTGFTGTSIWIDPPSETVVIILTSRLHPNDKGNVVGLRRKIGTLLAASLTNVQ